MKKVKNENLKNDCFTSLNRIFYNKKFIASKKTVASQLLDETIKSLEERLAELKEVRNFIMNEPLVIYLMKDGDSNYGYVDSNGCNYEYQVINNKPILIDNKFNLYEIIEYASFDDIGQDKGNRYTITSWIDKVIKVKKINN